MLEFFGDNLRVAKHATDMIGLVAGIKGWRPGISIRGNVRDAGEVGATQCVAPCFDHTLPNFDVGNLENLGKIFEHRCPDFGRNRSSFRIVIVHAVAVPVALFSESIDAVNSCAMGLRVIVSVVIAPTIRRTAAMPNANW